MNIIRYFSEVKIINMISRTDRRKETEHEFARHGFEINTPKVSFFDAITPSEPNGFPSKGARGCFLSHLSILENAVANKSSNILILEDDICFSKDIIELGEKSVRELDNMQWDIVYFGHSFENSKDKIQWLTLDKPTELSHFYAVNGQTIGRLAKGLREFLSRPAGHPEGGPMHYDGALNTFVSQNPDLKTYYISSDLGYQRASNTDIHDRSFINANPLLIPIMNKLRTLKQVYLRNTR